ncbi:MAG: hypothetical protein FWD61_13780 [Phycisphaerales bacterium]|nr:hypothetical protein [Phycisphaerales bacterium]
MAAVDAGVEGDERVGVAALCGGEKRFPGELPIVQIGADLVIAASRIKAVRAVEQPAVDQLAVVV